MRTSIYVDGFNLYFGALKRTPYKWLDLKAVCERMLSPKNKVSTIKYFTANVSSTPSNPTRSIHQQAYIRALLATCPSLEVIRGQFRTHQVMKRLVTPINGQRHALVEETTEKGSDVNLAVHLINDAWRDEFDCAVVISGDSGLAESIRLVREYHPKKPVGVIAPGKGSMSKELVMTASFIKMMRTSVLSLCQLPVAIPGTPITKPSDW